jgi:hypothetical protein
MKNFVTAGLALSALPCALSAQDYSADNENRDTPPERCVSATTLVPPFNNTSGALEQSRVAATTVESIRYRRGEAAYRVCKTSAVAPEISDAQGIDEKPLTNEEMRELDPEGTPAD